MAIRRALVRYLGRSVQMAPSDTLPASNIPVVVASQTDAASSKTTPANADALPIVDSAASNGLKKLTFSNLLAWIRANALVSGTNIKTAGGQSLVGSGDAPIVAPETTAASSKSTPVDADYVPLVDSAAANVLKKLTWANIKATLFAYFQGLFREKLTAARTYYVRTDGSDSNDGQANTSGGAFLTIQKAVDVASAFDLNGFTITIQLGDGTYTGVTAGKAYVGQGLISIDGNATTPGNVVVSTAATSFNMTNCGSYRLRNFRVQASAGYAIYANGARTALTLSGMVYGAMSGSGTHIYVTAQASVVQNNTSYSIVGGAYSHITVSEGGTLESSVCTVTLTGTPAFSFYAFVENLSLCRLVSNTYSGSATGPRYSASGGSVIFTNGAGATALPGNASGSATTGGQYL